ncbi:MAG TPA: hypothetical protein VKW78_16165 [Terriglobales bacterium]|nr:hypothetical protein [Terriglobales bacterium]
MSSSLIRRVYWSVLAVAFVVAFSVDSLAQYKPSSVPARDLNSTLAELMRVAPATNQDLSILQQQGGILHRVTFWRGDKGHSAQITEALRRNLQYAVPSFVHDTQASGGSLSTTFLLYRDLTVVCESLDTLLPQSSREGKGELAALNNDLSDMNRLKEELSNYIERTATLVESRNSQLASSTNRAPKRIIVDDNIPEKPVHKKRHTTNQ